MRKVILAVALVCLPIIAAAQATSLAPYFKLQLFDNSGAPCAGCSLYSYSAGTSTPLATYTDSSGLTQNTNPIVLDSAGRANIWLGGSAYKFVLKDASAVTLWTVDNVTNSSLLTTNNTWTGTNTFNGAVVFNGSVTFSGSSIVVAALNGDQYVLCAGTDDTSAFTTAISNVATGGRVIPVGACKLAPASPGSQLILINKTLSLDCHGWGGSASVNNVITVGSSVPGTTDVVRVAGGSTAIEGGGIYNCQFLPQSGTPARYPLNIDTTTYGISKFRIEHNFFGNFGSYGIKSTNPSLTDGFFGSWITHNEIFNGINLERVGDNVVIQANVITGSNMGVDATQVHGSTGFVFDNNNVTTTVACVHLGDGFPPPPISNNQCEGSVSVTGSNSAYIDIAGSVGWPVEHPIVINNTKIAGVASGITGLRLDYTNQPIVDGNRFYRAGGGAYDILVTANTQAGTGYIGFTNRYDPADSQSSILSDSASTLVCWNNPWSQVSQGGLGGAIECNRTVATSAGFLGGQFKSSGANASATGLVSLTKSDKIAWRNNANGADLPLGIDGSDNLAFNGNAFLSSSGALVAPATISNCNSAASPAVCGSAYAGSVVIAAAATNVVVNTTAVTANSQILLQQDASLGTRLGVTCNTNYFNPIVTGRTAGTGFTIVADSAPVTNPLCLSFSIIN